MLARFQQITVLLLLIACIAWAAWFTRAGHPYWAAAGVVLIAFGYAAFLGVEFVLLGLIGRSTPVVPAPTARQLIAAWWAEVQAAPRVFFWRQPFRSNVEPDLLVAARSGQRGVLLVHGFVCNRGLWNPWMQRLRTQGIPFVAVNLEPVFGSLDDYTGAIDAAVRRLEACTQLAPVIVGHSMGGLALRAWLREAANHARVHRLVTIGTPHQGTWLARFALTRNGRQMRLNSAWLTAPGSSGDQAAFRHFTCFYGHCDNIVFPALMATLPGADNRHIAGTAHVQMAFHAAVFSEVQAWLQPVPGAA